MSEYERRHVFESVGEGGAGQARGLAGGTPPPAVPEPTTHLSDAYAVIPTAGLYSVSMVVDREPRGITCHYQGTRLQPPVQDSITYPYPEHDTGVAAREAMFAKLSAHIAGGLAGA